MDEFPDIPDDETEVLQKLSGQALIHASFCLIMRLVTEFEAYDRKREGAIVARKDVASLERLCIGLLEMKRYRKIDPIINYYHGQCSAFRELARSKTKKCNAKLSWDEVMELFNILFNFPRNITVKLVTVKEPHLRLLTSSEARRLSNSRLPNATPIFQSPAYRPKLQGEDIDEEPYKSAATDESLEDALNSMVLELTLGTERSKGKENTLPLNASRQRDPSVGNVVPGGAIFDKAASLQKTVVNSDITESFVNRGLYCDL